MGVNKVMAGRTVGNTATVIRSHSALRDFPHDGWCDLQFTEMLDGASAAVFEDDSPLPFCPIIEVVSTHKLIFRQAALFECAIGAGRAIFITVNARANAPAARWFLHVLREYAASPAFRPQNALSLAQMEALLARRAAPRLDFDSECYADGNAVAPVYARS